MVKTGLYWAGFLFGIYCFCSSAELFVATDGCDVNPGTCDQPLATLEGAQEVLLEWKKLKNFRGQDIIVYLREGDYRIEQTVVFDEQDSGSAENQIVYRSYPGEKARLIGGRILDPSHFQPVMDPVILKRIPVEAHEHVLRIDLKREGITNYGRHRQFGHALAVVPAPLELFFNGDAMTLARYPNKGDIKIGKVIDPGSVPRVGDYENIRGGIFEYTDDRHDRWVDIKDVWLQGLFKHGFADDKIRINWIDPKTHQVKLATPHMYGLESGRNFQKYIALNLLEELDEPGEWYVDRETGILYFWPSSEMAGARIIVSVLEEPIVALEGVSYMTLQGLTVEGGRGIGIYMERGEHNRIAGCVVRNMGTSGIFMGQGALQTFSYVTHDDYEGVPVSRRIGSLQSYLYQNPTWDRKGGNFHQIISCDVYHTGCGGIYLSGGSKKDLVPGHCEAINCRVHDYNRRNKFLWSGINIDGCGNRIAHCEIYNSDFQGIYAHGNDHIYEYNHLHHLAMDSDDTSAWYLGRDPSDRGNIIRYNFFHHVGRPDRAAIMGIYCDDGTSGVTVEGNVFYRTATHGAVFINGGSDNKVRNNIFIETLGPAVCECALFYGPSQFEVEYFFGENGVYRRRLCVLLDVKTPPYSQRYPELAEWMDPIVEGTEWVGMRPQRNVMENNVMVHCPEKLKLMFDYARFDDINSLELHEDPGFVDTAMMNFQLRDDSIVYQILPEFQHIPFDKIGLYEDVYRREMK